MSNIREEDMHYLGGLFDGDGSFMIFDSKKDDYKFGYQQQPKVHINQGKISFEWDNLEVPYDGNYDLHYLGGLFDSDGSFSMTDGKKDGCKFGYQQQPWVIIGMKQEEYKNPTRELVEKLFSEYAPNCSTQELEKREENHSDIWKIQASGKSALELMDSLKPYLRLKKPQVDAIQSVDWERVHSDKHEFLYTSVVHEKITKYNNTTRKRDPEFFTDHLGVPMEEVEQMRDELENSDTKEEKEQIVQEIRPTESASEVSW